MLRKNPPAIAKIGEKEAKDRSEQRLRMDNKLRKIGIVTLCNDASENQDSCRVNLLHQVTIKGENLMMSFP